MARNVPFKVCHQHQRQWAKDLNFYAGKIQINLKVSLYLPQNDINKDKKGFKDAKRNTPGPGFGAFNNLVQVKTKAF